MSGDRDPAAVAPRWWIRASSWLVLGALGYIMLRPVSHNAILLPAIGLLFLGSAVLLWGRRVVSSALLWVIAAVIAVGLYGTAIGIGNPGLVYGVLVWVAGPVVFGTFAAAGDHTMVRRILWVSAVTTVVTSLYVLVYAAGVNGLIPKMLPYSLISELGPDPDPGTRESTDIRLYSLSTLVATVPTWLAATFLPASRWLPPKWLSATAGLLGLAAALNSGRASLVVVVVVVPVLMWVTWRVATRSTPRAAWRNVAPLGVVGVAGVVFVWLLSASTFVGRTWDRVSALLAGRAASPDDRIRSEQADVLLGAWRESPVFGHGWGAVVEGYVRTENRRPWNFELQYHMALFQVGVVGALVLVAMVATVLWCLVVVTRRLPEMLVPTLVVASGALSLLVANGSNPYLQAPGNMWPVYLLLMLMNVNLLAGRTRVDESGAPQTLAARVSAYLSRPVSSLRSLKPRSSSQG